MIPYFKNTQRILKYREKHYKSSKDKGCEDSSDSDSDDVDHSYDPASIVQHYRQEQKQLSDAEISLVVQRYSEGSSTYELAKEFGCHRSTISRVLKKSGIEVSHKATSRTALCEKILQLYADYMRPVDISKELGINVATVRKILHGNNVRIKHSSEYVSSHQYGCGKG